MHGTNELRADGSHIEPFSFFLSLSLSFNPPDPGVAILHGYMHSMIRMGDCGNWHLTATVCQYAAFLTDFVSRDFAGMSIGSGLGMFTGV